jgi:hypothetical protein
MIAKLQATVAMLMDEISLIRLDLSGASNTVVAKDHGIESSGQVSPRTVNQIKTNYYQ